MPSGSLTSIVAVPSPDGSKIAVVSPLPWCESLNSFTNQCSREEVYNIDSTPEYKAHVRFITLNTLTTISEYTSEWSSWGGLAYRWDIDETFIIRENDTNFLYRIDPNDSSYTVFNQTTFSSIPSTTSSEYSKDNNRVYFDLDNVLHVEPNNYLDGDSPFID